MTYNYGNGYGHIGIATDDLEGLHQKNLEAGFEITDLKGLPEIKPSFYFIVDPDCYKTELIRP